MTKAEFVRTLNDCGATATPFLFIADFELEKPLVLPLESAAGQDIFFNIGGVSNYERIEVLRPPAILDKNIISFREYKEKFELVADRLNYGDSYLTNLTVKTEINLKGSLYEMFQYSKAPYKLFYKDEFIVFSPECFVTIRGNMIYSFPMKGTIDASIPDAATIILNDEKELAEHVTIVDLIRNDLSQVAEHVHVSRFRYLDEIRTHQKNLLQVSSEIRGQLPPDFASRLGDIITSLLPAGSVSGAPKPKTLQIIADAEMEKRGYYTGVFGYFDGRDLNSGVMIRYIERKEDQYFYRSGGGITTQSNVHDEFQEIIDKVYVPVD